MLKENIQGYIFVGDWYKPAKHVSEYRLIMKLGIEFASHLHLLVERHVDCLAHCIHKEFSLLQLVLPHAAVEFHDGGEELRVLVGLWVDFLYFFNDDVDVVGGLDCLIIGGVYLVVIFREEIIVRNKCLLLHMLLLDHEDGDLTSVFSPPLQHMHVVVLQNRLANHVILYLLALQAGRHPTLLPI